MPSSHRRYADWTPERLRRQAGAIGRRASALVEIILQERTHPQQGFRACVEVATDRLRRHAAKRLHAITSSRLDLVTGSGRCLSRNVAATCLACSRFARACSK
jgi:hypothetical protein